MLIRRWLVALSLIVVPANSAFLHAQSTAAARVDFPITLERVQCYVVCDTLAVTITSERIFRNQRGQALGPGRIGVSVSGADTIPADSSRVAELVGALQQFIASGYPSQLHPGTRPCSDLWMSHAAVLSITWHGGTGERILNLSVACQEPTGLVQRLFRGAVSAFRLDTLPMTIRRGGL